MSEECCGAKVFHYFCWNVTTVAVPLLQAGKRNQKELLKKLRFFSLWKFPGRFPFWSFFLQLFHRYCLGGPSFDDLLLWGQPRVGSGSCVVRTAAREMERNSWIYIGNGEEGVRFRSVFALCFELWVAGVPPGEMWSLVRVLPQCPLEELVQGQAVMQIS